MRNELSRQKELECKLQMQLERKRLESLQKDIMTLASRNPNRTEESMTRAFETVARLDDVIAGLEYRYKAIFGL